MEPCDELMEIGRNAGKVYQQLEAAEELTVSALKKKCNLSETDVQRALGWLARETKIKLEKTPRTTYVRLI